MKKSYLFVAVLSVVVVMFFCSCETAEQAAGDAGASTPAVNTHGQAGVKDEVSKPNILQVALGSKDHTTLVVAVKAAQLENVLVNAGPLTVFAPNNAAFEKLPAGTVENLLKPENKNKLANIITSHASPGSFKGDLLQPGTKIYLATGQYVNVEVKDGATYVNGAKILGTVDASNGVVHVVDTVFLF